jgi:hypothetical protein
MESALFIDFLGEKQLAVIIIMMNFNLQIGNFNENRIDLIIIIMKVIKNFIVFAVYKGFLGK